jgi:hypothetical protein
MRLSLSESIRGEEIKLSSEKGDLSFRRRESIYIHSDMVYSMNDNPRISNFKVIMHISGGRTDG